MDRTTTNGNEHKKEMIGEKGVISSVAVLDLRNMKAIEELSHISRINSVGVILVSDSFKGTLASVPMNSIGGIVTIPEGSKVNQISGTIKMTEDFLHNTNGDGSEILLVSGELFITSPITKIGFKQIIISGQLYVPRGSEVILSPFITQMIGELVYYNHQNPRVFTGTDRFGKDFFTYLKEPITMILMGEFTIESDVSVELLQEKVSEIILMGH